MGAGVAGGIGLGVAEIGAWYHPKNKQKSNPGYMGGTLRVPIRYKTIFENYSTAIVHDFYGMTNLGAIKLPIPEESNETRIQKTLGWSFSLGTEIMLAKKGIVFAFPIDLGLGKMHFNQSFKDQNVLNSSDFTLQSTLILSAGVRIFFIKNNCDDYISNLQ